MLYGLMQMEMNDKQFDVIVNDEYALYANDGYVC